MEKISGIIPSSARVTNADLKSSGTVRPGAPAFGRPVGRSAPAARELTTAQKAMEQLNQLPRLKGPPDPHVQIVHDMADKFFVQNKVQPEDIDLNDPKYQVETPEVSVNELALLEGIEQTKEPVTVDYALEAIGVIENSEKTTEDDLDQAISGSNLDVRV